ncbi:hypothetical protein OEZ86_003965 [Tetradesmus obliquus]|nr:hypothetical protein OEZ86_003965 [Tetradesmus obliquus]
MHLLKDAIHVYKTEGAAAVVPDQVTEVFMAVYSSLAGPQQQLTFFTLLAREFGVQGAAVDAAVQLWQDKGQAQNASPELLYRLADRLTAAAQPLYMQLLLPVSQHKAGIAFLVRLRSDLLQLLREQPGLPQAAALRALSQDLRSALARWFSVGLLQLQRITWEDTPGQLLERVMAAEAVHRMQHLGQLKRRLQQSDRRVFAFLHPSMPPGLDNSSSGPGSVACFYSISSGQPGLSGVDLGNFLIKKAAQQLLAELPQLQHLVTLSPIPGFRAWLITKLQAAAAAAAGGSSGAASNSAGQEPQLLKPHEADTVARLHAQLIQQQQQQQQPHSVSGTSTSTSGAVSSSSSSAAASAALLQLVQANAWLQLPEAGQAALQPVLLRLCGRYLLAETRRGWALDPVQHFHLKNGAWLWRINTRADLSAAGLERSCGLMVNYKYVLADVTANNRAYLVDQHIAAAAELRRLLD